MSDYELPESRLGTTDESGERVYVHPHDVKGKWTRVRKTIYWFLIFIYLVFPWIRVGGKQLVLLDLPAREFYIFGTTFYGHDGPFLIFFILAFLFLIAFVTSVWGRVWCGYACPQTVFIDAIYRWIERKVEGSGPKRDKLEKAPWNLEKIFKRTLKWLLYTLVSVHIVHSGIGYFVGTHELFHITTQSPASNMYLFILMLSLSLIILIDFGWFREQFCIIACPYGRFQSIVMDENSVVVAYDKKRGEPRKRTRGVDPVDEGDCVNCNRCVHVCPTGIDIREGLQMECIACTMCIDACNEIMLKVQKPLDLIKYTTENKVSGKQSKRSPRVYIYFILLLITGIGLLTSLNLRNELKAQFIRETGAPFQFIESQNLVVNHFKIKLRYQNDHKLEIDIISDLDGLEIINPEEVIELQNINRSLDVFFKFSTNILINGERKVRIQFRDIDSKKIILEKDIQIVGPISNSL
jgi:cytochrome c oxidase accessory protein FixG